MTIIDFGCGEGMHIFPFARRYKYVQFYGFDKNADTIKLCNVFKEKYKIDNVNFKKVDIENDEISLNSQLIISVAVFPYLYNHEKVVSKIYNLLESKGTFCLYVPVNDITIIKRYSYYKNKYSHYDKVQEKKRIFQLDDALYLLKKNGFSILKYTFTNGFLGIISHEIYAMYLLILSNGNWFFRILCTLIFTAFSPLILIMKLIDYCIKHKNGNGLLVIAKKE